MKLLAKTFSAVAILAFAAAVAAKDTAPTQGESSVLVEKKSEAATKSPKLLPPANQRTAQTLPPPANPAVDSETLSEPATKQPFMRPATPKRRVPATTALSVTEEPMPAPEVTEVAEIEVRPTPPIEYDTDRDARRMYRSSGEVELVMVTQNPADGCFYEIPMCVPACCIGEPSVSSGRGLLGRGVVEYCWPSGFRAVVKFRQIVRGDVKVEYEGD